MKWRAVVALVVGVAEMAALILGFVVVLGLGRAGLWLAVLMGLAAPIGASAACRRILRGRCSITLVAVAAPVWIVVAMMSSFFTSFWIFVDGDAVRWESVAAVAAAATVGGAIGTRTGRGQLAA